MPKFRKVGWPRVLKARCTLATCPHTFAVSPMWSLACSAVRVGVLAGRAASDAHAARQTKNANRKRRPFTVHSLQTDARNLGRRMRRPISKRKAAEFKNNSALPTLPMREGTREKSGRHKTAGAATGLCERARIYPCRKPAPNPNFIALSGKRGWARIATG